MDNEKNTFEPNEQQTAAIEEPYEKRSVVTAAAGSGKTMLLVERIVRLLSDRDLDIKADQIAVMTFTRNATKNLRERLNKALKSKLGDHPKDSEEHAYISEQILLLRQAYISTIDSFCLRIIRENPEAFDLPLNFSMATMVKKITMRLRAAELAMKEFYNEDTGDESDPNRAIFGEDERRALFYTFNFENDNALQENLMSVEDKLSTYADADEWLRKTADTYSSLQNYENCYLGITSAQLENYYNKAVKLLEEYDDILSKIEDQAKANFKKKDQKTYDAFYDNTFTPMKKYIKADRDRFEIFISRYEEFREEQNIKNANILISEFKNNIKIESCPRLSGCPKGVEASKRFTETKNRLIKLADKIAKLDFSSESDPARFKTLQTSVLTFIKLLRRYHDLYTDIKKASGNLDFSDCELMLLKKLSDESFREKIAGRFKCVIVDEFQDSNDIQAEIFKKIGGNNLFYVGDVKQSIYAFRGGNPMIMARLCGGADDFTVFPLNKNYRSRESVINTANAAFSGLMTAEYGGVDYADPQNILECGAKFLNGNSKEYLSEIVLVSGGKSGEKNADKEMLGPRAVAQKIKQLHDDETFFITKDKKLVRPDYSDFTILMRNNTRMPYYRLALAELGVAAVTPGGKKFLETDEISLILDYLTIVDNPQRNEQVLKVLMSPIYRLNAEELSLIRLGLLGIDPEDLTADEKSAVIDNAKGHSLYSCIRICTKTEYTIPKTEKIITRKVNSKLLAFFDDITRFRYFMCTNSVYKLVCKICEDTDLLSTVAAFSDSEQCIANVRQFQDMAAEFESRDGGSLSDFLRYIEYARSLKDNKVEEAKRPDNAEAVKIMTFHASKGLEFPVCIMCELEEGMSESDTSGSLILNRDKFLAVKSVDLNRRVKTENLAYSTVKAAVKKGLIGEELRLLYVAMTRAQDKLIMFAQMTEDTQKKWKSVTLDPDDPTEVFEQSTPFKWIFVSLMRYCNIDSGTFPDNVSCVMTGIKAPDKPGMLSAAEFNDISDAEVKALADKIGFKYKYENDTRRQAKFSVTELAHMDSKSELVIFKKPDFVKKGDLSGDEIGTAYHKCMEIIPLDELKSSTNSKYSEIVSAAIKNTDELDENEKRVINPKKIVEFLTSELGKRMLKSSEIRRESRFFEKLDGNDIGRPELGFFTLQGVIDMYFVDSDNRIVMVDYKTDSVENFEKERESYEKQVKMYSTVLPRQTSLPVKEIYLYTFTDGKEYRIL